MAWTIEYNNEKRFDKDRNGLQRAEESKFARWLRNIPSYGPFDAADVEHIRLTPLSTGQYHLYIGSYKRVFFDADNTNETVTLQGIGHT